MKKGLCLAAVFAAACGQEPSPPPRLYFTCGDPVCRGYTAPAGVPRCTTPQGEGAACPAVGATCDPVDECNRLLVCAREDPAAGPGGCPISRAAFKKDVRYLDDRDLDRQHAAVLRLPLATWRYRSDGEGTPSRLGFLIDDVGAAACVDRSGGRVDLYGYTSMTVAAVQVQAREIAELRREVAALRAEVRAGGGRR
jgi:hypothetical protein